MQVKKKLDPSYLVHNNRVIADGGTPGNGFLSDRNVTILKRGGLWNNCVFFVDGIDGKKVDYDGTVSKLYDLKGNADLSQSTYTLQPTILNNGSSVQNSLYYLQSPTLSAGNPVRDTVNKITVVTWIKAESVASVTNFSRRYSGAGDRVYYFGSQIATPTKPTVFLVSNGTDIVKNFTGSKTVIDGTWHMASFTYDKDGPDGGKTGLLKLQVDGVQDASITRTVNLDATALFTGGTVLYSVTNGQQGTHMIFNRVLTDAELLYLKANTNPERISNIVSPTTATYISAVEADGGLVKFPLLANQQMDKMVGSGFWSNCVYYHDGIGGKKVDAAGSVSKIYDWCPGTKHNLVQATAATQPKLMTDGAIMHNATYVATANLGASDNIKLLVNNFSWGCWFNTAAQTVQAGRTIFGRWGIQNYCWSIQHSVNTINRVYFSVAATSGANTTKRYETAADVCDGNWHFALFTWASGTMKIYIDGVEDTNPTKVKDDAITTMYDNVEPLCEGLGVIGRVGSTMGFNKVLSQAEITWLYNNTRDTSRLSKMYSPDTIAHVNRVENTNLLILAAGVHCYITDPSFVETVFSKMRQYNLTAYAKLISFGDGGIIDLGAGLTRGIFNLMDTGIDNRGISETNYQPTLYRSPFENARLGLLNQLTTAYSGMMFTSSSMKGIFRNKTKGAMINVMRKIANGAVGSSIYNGFSNNSSTLSSRFAHQQLYAVDVNTYTPRTNIKTLDASGTQVFSGSNASVNTSKVQLSFADWTNKQISTWINGVAGEVATVFTADNGPTSDTDSYYVFMGGNPSTATGSGVCNGVSFFMSAFEGDFDINNLKLLEADIRNYYGVI